MWSPPTLAEKNPEKQLTLHTIKLPSRTFAHCYPSSSPLSALGAEPFTWRQFVDGHRAFLLHYREKDSSPTKACCCCTHPGLANRTMLASHARSTSLQLGSDRSRHREKRDEGWAWRLSWKRGVCAKFSLQQWRALCFSFLCSSHTFLTFDTMGLIMVLAPLHRGPAHVFSPANDSKSKVHN